MLQSAKKFFDTRVGGILSSRKWSIDTFPVRVVITGIEHSGTTLLSTLLKQDPRLNSGFECGFLLADSPHGFENVHPWYEWMQEPVTVHQWGVSAEHMDCICSSKSWAEAYQKLLQYSPVFEKGITQQICDKTPRYMSSLDVVLDKLPDFVPCIVIEKDIESLWQSHKKRNARLEIFCSQFERYNNGLRRALKRHGERIHRVKYETLCVDLEAQVRNVFSIIDLPFKTEYASNRYSNIQQYCNRQSAKVVTYKEEEVTQLARLRNQFADLLIK